MPSLSLQLALKGYLLKESLIVKEAQICSVQQFTLPKDEHFLQAMPNLGLQLALKGNLLKESLIAEELFDRLFHMHGHPTDLREALAKEKSAREEVEKRITALEAEHNRDEASRRRELDAKENLIKRYMLHHRKQAASIKRLHGDVAELKEGINHLKWEIAERDDRIAYLGEEVGAEKQHRVEAQESARVDHLVVKSLK